MTRAADTALASTLTRPRSRSRLASSRTRSSRSTVAVGRSMAPDSDRARKRRSSTRPCSCVASASRLRKVLSGSTVPGWARPTSSSERILVRGPRSSWDASATNSRCRSVACCSRSSISFLVRASREISSYEPRTGTRRCSSVPWMLATSARIGSTGRRTRPVSHHTRAASSATTTGMEMASDVLRMLTLSLTSSRFFATTRVPVAEPESTLRARTRNSCELSPTCESLVISWPDPGASGRVTAGNVRTLALAATTRPRESTSCRNESSRSPSVGSSPPNAPRATSSWMLSARCTSASSIPRVSRLRCTTTSPTALMTSTTATTTVASSVSRDRTVPRWRLPRDPPDSPRIADQPVPRTSHRLYVVPAERLVDLAAQPSDVDLDDVRVPVEVVLPDAVEQLELRGDEPGPPHQVLEHRELPRREPDLGHPPPASAPRRVDAQVTHLDGHRGAARGPPQQGPDVGDEHRERERLGQVVVGAGVEGLRLVVLAVLRRQDQDRRPVPPLPEHAADLEPVPAGEHQIQDQQVVAVLGGFPQTVLAVEGHVDGEALGVEPALHRRRDLRVVLDQEDLHGASLRKRQAAPPL